VTTIERRSSSRLFLFGIVPIKFTLSRRIKTGKNRKQPNISISVGTNVMNPGIPFKLYAKNVEIEIAARVLINPK
jgi:hypothetical protein